MMIGCVGASETRFEESEREFTYKLSKIYRSVIVVRMVAVEERQHSNDDDGERILNDDE